MQHAIYTPAPSTKKLEATSTGRTSRVSGKVRVAFCVGERGKPTRCLGLDQDVRARDQSEERFPRRGLLEVDLDFDLGNQDIGR